MNDTSSGPERAFLLGFDGVPWELIERWAAAGVLPNFERVLSEGAGGPLESTIPPTTPLAWPAIATGTWPDRHGVIGFKRLSRDYQQRLYTSEDVEQPELWDLLSPALVGNVPMTYPAAPIDGTMLTGMMTPSLNERSTYPPAFATEVEERVPTYRIGLQWSEYADRQDEFLRDVGAMVEARRAVMRLLLEREDWRLCFFVFTAPDRLQHLIWDESVLREHYRLLDAILGEVLDEVERRGAVLFAVSDHGFGPLSKIVYVNRFLEERGYLTRREDTGTRGILRRFGVSKSTVTGLLERVGITEEMLVTYLPHWLTDAAAERVPGEHALFDVDHTRTRAFMFGSGSIFINDSRRFASGVVPPADVPALTAELSDALASLRDPETGDPVLTVHEGSTLYRDGDLVPDLVVEGRPGYEKMTTLTDDVLLSSEEVGTAAGHRSEGMLLAWGPSIRAGSVPTDATVVDVAPTLLHCLDEPIGESMDGRVLEELLDPESAPGRRTPRWHDYEDRRSKPARSSADAEETGDVEERLRGLGYIE